MKRVTIIGAGGFIGSAITAAFLRKGTFAITATGSRTRGMLGLFDLPRGAELLTTHAHNLDRPDSLAPLIRDSDSIVICTSPSPQGLRLFSDQPPSEVDPRRVVVDSVRVVDVVVEAAMQSPVPRTIVHISSLTTMLDYRNMDNQLYTPHRWNPFVGEYARDPESAAFWSYAKQHPFSASKAAAEAAFLSLASSSAAAGRELRFVSLCAGLCLGTMYNPSATASLSIGLLQGIIAGRRCRLCLPITFVDDLADAVLASCMRSHASGRYIVSSASSYRPTPDFARTLLRHADRYGHLLRNLVVESDVADTYEAGVGSADISRTQQELGVSCDTNVEEALLPQVETMLDHGLFDEVLGRVSEEDGGRKPVVDPPETSLLLGGGEARTSTWEPPKGQAAAAV